MSCHSTCCPDRNKQSEQATADFQALLSDYQTQLDVPFIIIGIRSHSHNMITILNRKMQFSDV